MPVLPSAPIDQFDEYNDPIDGDFFAIVDTRTTVTKKINVKYFFPAPPSTNYEWSSIFSYALDAIVAYKGKWYKSLVDPNLGNNPETSPSSWELQIKSQSGFVYWQAGVFVGDPVIVLRPLDSFDQIFKLVNVTRPYLSADFENEYTAGDWELMSERGYIGATKAAHGFALNDTLTFKAGAWNKFTTGDKPLAIVRHVESVNQFIAVVLGNRLKGLSGLTAGSIYYAQSNATITTSVTDNPIMLAVSATEAILFAAGGGTPSPFKGLFASSAALASAFPTASPGEYAYVDTGVGADVQFWAWDNNDTAWKQVGGVSIVAWSATVPGTVERSTTAEAQNVVTRALAGSSDASNSDARTPSEKGLVEMILSFVAGAWTWAALQIYTTGIRLVNTTASQFLRSDATKNVVSVPASAISDINTGTDDTMPITAFGLKGSIYETQYGLRTFAASTSAANTYAWNLAPAITTYGSGGLLMKVRFTNANTGAATGNANTLGALAIVMPDGSALPAGAIGAGSTKILQYDGTSLVLINPSVVSLGAATPSTIAWWDSAKRLTSIAYGALADLVAGTDATKPLASATIKAWVDYTELTPGLSGGTLTVNCTDKVISQHAYATLTASCAIALSNDTNAKIISLVLAVTGTGIVLTFPSTFRMSRSSEANSFWNQSTKALTISSGGAGDLHEFSFKKTGSVWIIRYDGPIRP